MARLWIENIEDGSSDEELQKLLNKYGFPNFDAIEHLPGDGSRPATLVAFKGVAPEALALLVPRIQGLFWRHRKLSVHVMGDNFA